MNLTKQHTCISAFRNDANRYFPPLLLYFSYQDRLRKYREQLGHVSELREPDGVADRRLTSPS
jgi:hypothetical protein